MIRYHYPLLFDDDSEMARRAKVLAGKTHELISFLVDILKVDGISAA